MLTSCISLSGKKIANFGQESPFTFLFWIFSVCKWIFYFIKIVVKCSCDGRIALVCHKIPNSTSSGTKSLKKINSKLLFWTNIFYLASNIPKSKLTIANLNAFIEIFSELFFKVISLTKKGIFLGSKFAILNPFCKVMLY